MRAGLHFPLRNRLMREGSTDRVCVSSLLEACVMFIRKMSLS